jgi:hypothetical protein
MENIEEFNVTDTMLWSKVKGGLAKNWLENVADDRDVDYLVEVYNDEYDGGIFKYEEDAIYDAFSDVCEAFECGVNSQGNYNSSDDWFKVESYDNMLYSYSDYDMLEKLRDEMSCDIRYLADDIEDCKVDPDNSYKDIVKDITLTQRHYSKALEVINSDLNKYIDENKQKGYGVADLKENLTGFEDKCRTFDFVPTSDNLTALIDGRNTRVKELLNNNSAFLKGALYGTLIDNNAKNTKDVLSQITNYYGLSDEFIERHQAEFDEVNLNFAKIGEFIQ